jgi:hypothetical protein
VFEPAALEDAPPADEPPEDAPPADEPPADELTAPAPAPAPAEVAGAAAADVAVVAAELPAAVVEDELQEIRDPASTAARTAPTNRDREDADMWREFPS